MNISKFFLGQAAGLLPEVAALHSLALFKLSVLAVFVVLLVSFALPEHFKFPALAGFAILGFIFAYFTLFNLATLDLPLRRKPLWNWGPASLKLSQLIVYYMNSIPLLMQLRSTMRSPRQATKVAPRPALTGSCCAWASSRPAE